MLSQTNKSTSFDRPKWLIRVSFANDSEMIFSITTRDIRKFITSNVKTLKLIGANTGIINKYIFPYVEHRIGDKPIKRIKIRGK